MSGFDALLEFRSISKRHGTRLVLHDCSFAVQKGEHTALLGASGCGKSTVLRLLAGLETPTAGEVLVDGVLASSSAGIFVPPHERRLAMVFQDLALWPTLSVRENVLLGLWGSRASKEARLTHTAAALQLCRIEDLAQRFPGSLSGGEQQRVALARSLAAAPSVLLLDEPFAGLDLATKREILADLRTVIVERSVTVCLVTHDPLEAMTLCGRAAVLDGGRVLEQGPWEDLLREPRSAPLQAFRAALESVSASRPV